MNKFSIMLFAAAALVGVNASAHANEDNVSFYVKEFAKQNNPHPQRVYYQRNARRVVQRVAAAPVQVVQRSYGHVNGAAQWLLARVGTNPTALHSLSCGRGIRQAAWDAGYKDCAAGDHVSGWLSPACTTPAAVGEVGSVRVTSRHVSIVIEGPGGSCGANGVRTVSTNSSGYNTIAPPFCESLYGATYRNLIPRGPTDVRYPYQPDTWSHRYRRVQVQPRSTQVSASQP